MSNPIFSHRQVDDLRTVWAEHPAGKRIPAFLALHPQFSQRQVNSKVKSLKLRGRLEPSSPPGSPDPRPGRLRQPTGRLDGNTPHSQGSVGTTVLPAVDPDEVACSLSKDDVQHLTTLDVWFDAEVQAAVKHLLDVAEHRLTKLRYDSLHGELAAADTRCANIRAEIALLGEWLEERALKQDNQRTDRCKPVAQAPVPPEATLPPKVQTQADEVAGVHAASMGKRPAFTLTPTKAATAVSMADATVDATVGVPGEVPTGVPFDNRWHVAWSGSHKLMPAVQSATKESDAKALAKAACDTAAQAGWAGVIRLFNPDGKLVRKWRVNCD